MNFTREPIIETVVTPREGCKLVVRSSKGNGQEDYFVDAVEVVSFGHSLFFRSLEKPKSFLVPVSDYEVLELRETRMVLKHVPSERSVKIGGGREQPPRQSREPHPEPRHQEKEAAPVAEGEEASETQAAPVDGAVTADKPNDRKRERRRRGRRGRSDRPADGSTPAATPAEGEESLSEASEENNEAADEVAVPKKEHAEGEPAEKKSQPSLLSRLFLPPPPIFRPRLEPKPQVQPQEPEQKSESVDAEPAKDEAEKPMDFEEKPFIPKEELPPSEENPTTEE